MDVEMRSDPFHLEMTIGSDTSYLAALRSLVEAFLKRAGAGLFRKSFVIACSMAMVEAVNNAIFHAHRNRTSLPIKIAMAVREGSVIMDVFDTGGGVDELKTAEPEPYVSHGRGLLIIRDAMTHVSSKVQGGWHRFRMVRTI
jgi:anti-sigma regulatory factor (Ser/Thr protein kinase)